ncbi:hypothetical protein V8F06_009007 [Rhypophila decipiens]
MAIHPPKQRAQQSPDYYQKRRQRHAEDGAPKRNHASKTKENMSVVPINKERIEAHYIGQNKEVDLSAEWNPEEDDFRVMTQVAVYPTQGRQPIKEA